jgi:hypothetical protein
MVRREVLGGAIRFPVGVAYAEEWLFYLKVARACRAGFVDEPLCLHHYTPGSLSRTDSARNTRGYCAVLRAIDAAFDDLTRTQRRVVRRNVAQACRQLGYDAYRACRFREALCHFVHSFRSEPKTAALFDVVQSAARSVIAGPTLRSRDRCRSDELPEATQ